MADPFTDVCVTCPSRDVLDDCAQCGECWERALFLMDELPATIPLTREQRDFLVKAGYSHAIQGRAVYADANAISYA